MNDITELVNTLMSPAHLSDGKNEVTGFCKAFRCLCMGMDACH